MDIPKYSEELIWKVPLIKNKKRPIPNYKKATPENETLFNKQFFETYDGNWGFYTKENGIAVMDFDCRDGKKKEVLKLINKKHDTKILETPHGFHVYYKINGEFPNKTLHYKNAGYSKTLKKFWNKNQTKYGNKLEGIDIIAGTNVLVVGENSIINNHIYKGINNKPIKEIEREVWDSKLNSYLIKRPRLMREGFTKIFRGEIDPNILAQQTGKTEMVYWKFAYIEALNKCHVEPRYLLAGLEYNNKGFDRKTTETQLRSTNAPEGKDLMLNETYNEYFPKDTVRVKIKTKDKSIKSYILIGDKILNKYDIITMTDSNEILIKSGNIYKKDKKGIINKLIKNEIKARNLSYNSTKGNVIAYIKDSSSFDRNDFCYDIDLINFKNGYIDLDDKPIELHKNNSKKFPFELPHTYRDGEHDCPRYKKALNDWLGKNSVFEPSDMFEMIGYFMTLDISQKKAFMIYGDKDTGKTQNLSIILDIIGNDNYAQIELQRLDKNEFGTVGMEFRTLCIDDDLPADKLKGASKFKKMVGGLKYVGAEIKGGNQYQFRNTIRFVFNCNKIPQAYDATDDAFFIRWLLCNFCNIYEEDAEGTIKDFAKTIIDDENEIQGIIHESIKGVQRLRERGFFRRELREETKRVWQRISNPLYEFIDDYCIGYPSFEIKTTDFLEIFNSFLTINEKCEPYSAQKLTSEMRRLGYFKKRVNNKRVFRGLKIKDSGYIEFADEDDY